MSSSTPPSASPPPSTNTEGQDAADVPFNSPDADIIIRSSDGCDFRVHRLILSLGSAAFENMFAAQPHAFIPSLADIPIPSDSESDDFKDGLPVIRLTETASTLRILFTLLYPGDHPKISGCATIIAIANAMDKYMIEGYPKFIAAALRTVVEEAPHLVLALGFRHNLPLMLRRKAAVNTLRKPATTISDDALELLTLSQYRRILSYHEQCTLQASLALKKLDWALNARIEVAVGSKRTGGILRLADNTHGCTCSRFLRVHESTSKSESDGDTDTAAKTRQISVHIASWAAQFVTSLEACLWRGPLWRNLADAERDAVQVAKKCETCKPKAEMELRLVAELLAGAVTQAITEARPMSSV